MTAPRTTPADALRHHVQALARPTKRKIMRDLGSTQPGEPTTVEALVPSLIDQLADSAESGTERRGGSAVPGSRPPTGEDALIVRMIIESGTARRRIAVGLRPLDDTAAALRGLAEALIATGDDDQVAELADLVHGWVRQARAALHIAYSARELLGVPCPMGRCRTTWVASGDDGRAAALIIVTSDLGQVRAAQCRACGTVWWRGDALDQLGAYVRGLGGAIRAGTVRDTGQPQGAGQ